MGSETVVLPFREAVEVNPKVSLKSGTVYPFVEMKAIEPSRRNVSESEFRVAGGGSRFEPGDTLMARITPCLENGKVARYLPSAGIDGPAFGSTEFIVIRGRKGVTTDEFAYYLTKSPEFHSFAVAQMTGSSGRQRVPVEAFDKYLVEVPPIEEQKRIAHILGTLDDKIELNRQMNRTLEEMARALFKSWFVDFDPVRAKMSGRWTRTTPLPGLPGLPTSLFDLFPDHLVDSPLGEIPAGWSVGCLGDEFVITMGQSPPGNTYNEIGEGVPFFQGRSDFGFRYPQNRVFCTSPTRFSEAGDTLVSVRAPVGDINMAFERCCVGRGVAAVRHRSGVTTYTYYKMASLKQVFMDFDREGTVFGAINKDAFNGLPSVVVPEPVLRSFEATVRSIEHRLGKNEIESRWLTELRQELIGHLMSGARALEA
ncbi:MAG TPA: restriction endonuclease subunit S [Myxococcota bacterium]|nr:restriction endonuclease subunit S [Myxococcota bacterium]